MRLIYYISITSLSFVLLSACSHKNDERAKESIEVASSNDSLDQMVDDDRDYIVKVGDMAPDFEMSLSNGDKIKLSSLRGKVVMLQFTASWCGVCRKEMPHIEKDIWIKHRNNPDFVLYGVDREEPIEKVEELIQKTGVTYPIGLDPDAEIFSLYAKKDAGITRNVIIGKDGRIVMLTRLFEMEEFMKMVDLIDNLLSS